MNRVDLSQNIVVLEQHRKKIHGYLSSLNTLYTARQISRETYNLRMQQLIDGRTPLQWLTYYDELLSTHREELHRQSALPEPEKRGYLHIFLALFVVLGFVGFVFMQPGLTGFSINDLTSHGTVAQESTDGYHVEGQKWADIRGSRFYERCLKVTATHPFEEVSIVGKITQAIEREQLQYTLYAHDAAFDQPGLALGSCTVKTYADVWKTCSVSTLSQPAGNYWICAAVPTGEYGATHYLLAYQNGDTGRTAFWTGQNWQKLDRSSYTLKAQFTHYA